MSVSLYLYHLRADMADISVISASQTWQHRSQSVPPPALPPAICFCQYHNIVPGVSVFVCLLFSVAPHSSHLNNTSLSYALSRSNGALWEYTLYAKGVCVGIDSAVISVQDCVFVCVCMWVGGCVSESIYKGISPGGVDASLQWRESKGGGGKL